MSTQDQFQRQLRDRLVASGWSSAEVADKIGVHPVTVRRFRSGATPLRDETARKLMDFLGLRADVKISKIN